MTQAEQEIIETFCHELALALRRITGKNIVICPQDLPRPIESEQAQLVGSINPGRESTR
jgi:hypothetical protein